jgi:hypothetical protein
MGRLLQLPNDVGVMIGTFVPVDEIVVNTRSQALVAAIAPLTEPFWRHLCRELGIRSSLAHEQPWRKCLLLYVLPLRRAVIAGDWVSIRNNFSYNFQGPGPVSRFEVPAEMLCSALRIGDESRKLEVLRTLLRFGTAPDAANHLGEALVAHAASYCGANVHIFRVIASHLQRWNIKISALHYIQATHNAWRMQWSGETEHFAVDLRRVSCPDVFRLSFRLGSDGSRALNSTGQAGRGLFRLALTLCRDGEHERARSLLEGR